MDAKKIGEAIRMARVKRRMSQGTLAELVGVTKPAISNWECGKTSLKAEYFLKVVEILELENEFFKKKPSKPVDIAIEKLAEMEKQIAQLREDLVPC